MYSKKEYSWKKRFQYAFDNFMARGGFSVFLALLSAFVVAFIIMAVFRTAAEAVFPNSHIDSISDVLWDVFVLLIGVGEPDGETNLPSRVVTIVTIFIGLILFSSMVAFITEEFESKLQALRRGKSVVVEVNHTLILGFGDRVIDIVNELVISNESEKDAAIVVLSERDKEEMDDFLWDNIKELKTTRLVTRTGSTTSLYHLENVGVGVAKTVVILNDAIASDRENIKASSDARAIKAIMAVVAATGENTPSIIAEVHSEKYRTLAESIAPGLVTTLNEVEILARILVQTSRNIGLAQLYLELVGFEGQEFYFYRPPSGWPGIVFKELPFYFPASLPIGIRKADGTLTIRPDKDYLLENSDDVLLVTEDDSIISFSEQLLFQPRHFDFEAHQEGQTSEQKPEKYLIIGWSNKVPLILQEYASYLSAGSQVDLLVESLTDRANEICQKIRDRYPHIKIQGFQGDVLSKETLRRLNLHEFNSVSILASSKGNAEETDAKTIATLLQIRQIFQEHTALTGEVVETELIAEVINSEDTELMIKAGVRDFLLTNQFVSKILAQVSQEPDLMAIYQELFSEEGSEVYLKPVSLYVPTEYLDRLTYADCIAAAFARNEICLGVRIDSKKRAQDKNLGTDVYLAPPKDKILHLTAKDSFIVIAGDEI